MATIAAQITELEAELASIKSAMTAMLAGGQSSNVAGFSVNRVSYSTLAERRAEIEKSLQRLKTGGRGIVQDLSYGHITI